MVDLSKYAPWPSPERQARDLRKPWTAGPCDYCELRRRCAAMRTACKSFFEFSRGRPWRELEREPTFKLGREALR